jgi:hypothetical protein
MIFTTCPLSGCDALMPRDRSGSTIHRITQLSLPSP